eukprot:scaffold520_cov271-Chaetoceros_neogracile.AAC.3
MLGNDSEAEESSVSALRDNIENKGKNSYYFAHAKTPTGPEWDGKPEPRLLAKHSSVEAEGSLIEFTKSLHISNDGTTDLLQGLKQNAPSFDFAKSNITKYAFLDDGAKIKIYVELKGVGDICTNDEDVTLDWQERSFSLVVRNYEVEGKVESEIKSLCFGRLHGSIKKATMKKKIDKIIVILTKLTKEGEEPQDWPGIGAKGGLQDDIV